MHTPKLGHAKIQNIVYQPIVKWIFLSDEVRKKKGYSVQLQKKYRDSGWLTAICKGVMCRTGARLNAYDAIASYNKQMGGTML